MKKITKYMFMLLAIIICLLPGFRVAAAEKPGEFSITSPKTNAFVSDDITIEWEKSSGASYYTLSIRNLDTDKLLDDYNLKKVYGTSASLDYDDLTPGAKYKIGVVAYASDGVAFRNGGTVEFVAALGEFSITSPKDDAEITGDFTVKWSKSEEADFYTISIKDMTNNTYVTELEEVSKTSYSVSYSELIDGHTYKIGVVAYNNGRTSSRNGGTVEFTVGSDCDFDIKRPVGGSKVPLENLSVSWYACEEMEYYQYSLPHHFGLQPSLRQKVPSYHNHLAAFLH